MTPEEWFHQRWKDGRPLGKLLKESPVKPLKRTLTWCRWPGRTTSKCTAQNLTTRAPMIYLTCSWRRPLLLPFLTLMSTKSRMCGLARRTPRLPIEWQNLPKRHSLLLGSAPNWVAQDHGLERDTFPRGPEMTGWPVILPLVWQGGAEQGHSLGLVCSWCLEYFMTSTDTMCHQVQLWQSAPACSNDDDDNHEEESDAENTKNDDDFTFV